MNGWTEKLRDPTGNLEGRHGALLLYPIWGPKAAVRIG